MPLGQRGFQQGHPRYGGRHAGVVPATQAKTARMRTMAHLETLAYAAQELRVTRADLNDLTPLAIVEIIMLERFKAGDDAGALAAAAIALPFRHARLAQTELTVRQNYADRSTEQLLAEAQEIRARLIEHDPDELNPAFSAADKNNR